MTAKQPPGPPMTLGNTRELGVRNLIASCLSEACRHTALIDVSSYPARDRGPVVPASREVRQVRRALPTYRCAPELERATKPASPSW